MDTAESSQLSRGRGKNKRQWSPAEDRILIEALQEVATEPRWKGEGGWRNGYLYRVEELIHAKLPTSGLKAFPHIDSRWKTLKAKHHALSEMMGKSGFTWDDVNKKICGDQSAYEEWCKVHKEAKGLLNISFPLFDEIGALLGKDRAIGREAETFTEAVQNMELETENENVNLDSDGDDDDFSTTQPESQPVSSRTKRQRNTFKGKEPKESAESTNMTANFHTMTTNFGIFMQEANSYLGVMANTISRAEEREQEMSLKADSVLDELKKIEGLASTEILDAAEILAKEPHKLKVFYQADPYLRRQYVMGFLRTAGNGNGSWY